MVGGGRAVAAAVLAAAAVCLLVSAAHRGGRVELEESNAERIARLQEEAKAKTIEARISQTASQLERERAVREKNAAEAQATQRNAMRDKREAEGDFSKAKTLASAAARAEQAARLAAHRAKSAAHVLHLKMRVAGLLKSRAEDEEHRAMQAQVAADAVKARVLRVRDEIARLQQAAKVKRLEADERISVGQKLLSTAKALSVKAKAVQEKKLARHPLTQDMVVSPQALRVMTSEARRVGHLLQVDANGLQRAEKLVRAVSASPAEHPTHPLLRRIAHASTVFRRLRE